MKKRLLLFPFAMLLFACSNTEVNETLVASDTNANVETQNEMTLTSSEALNIAKEVITQINEIYDNQWAFEGENPPDDVVKERLSKLKNYTTNTLYERYYTFEAIYCGSPDCDVLIPSNLQFGIRHDVTIVDHTHFHVAGFFPSRSYKTTESNYQIASFIFENNSWKLADLTQQQMDMNLLPEEVEAYLKAHYQPFASLEDAGVIELDGREEHVFTFQNHVLEENYLLLLRTGEIRYVYEETDPDYENEFSAYFDVYLETDARDLLHQLLLEDQSPFRYEIIASTDEEIAFLTRWDELEQQLPFDYDIGARFYERGHDWTAEPALNYDEAQYAQLLSVYEQYQALLADVYEYYMQFDDTTTDFSYYEQSWRNVRSHYFEMNDVDYNTLAEDGNIYLIQNDVLIFRNQILRLLAYKARTY